MSAGRGTQIYGTRIRYGTYVEKFTDEDIAVFQARCATGMSGRMIFGQNVLELSGGKTSDGTLVPWIISTAAHEVGHGLGLTHAPNELSEKIFGHRSLMTYGGDDRRLTYFDAVNLRNKFFAVGRMRMDRELFIALFFSSVLVAACSSEKEESRLRQASVLDVGQVIDGSFCHRRFKVDSLSVSQISLHSSKDCETYAGPYLCHISSDGIAEEFVVYWLKNGRSRISSYAMEKGEAGIAKALSSGLQPEVVVVSPGKSKEIEINFSDAGFSYIFVLDSSNFDPIGLKVWQ